MLHEFDAWLEARYLNEKARKDRWAWNFGIQKGRPIAVRENRQWKPAVAYCRYADDFVVIVKGTKAQAEEIREECRVFLEGSLKLTLNMEKTHVTHVNDGFVFLGHRIIRKRGSSGRMSVVTTIPKEKAKAFARKLSEPLSGNHDVANHDVGKVDMVGLIQHTDRGSQYCSQDYQRLLNTRGIIPSMSGRAIASIAPWSKPCSRRSRTSWSGEPASRPAKLPNWPLADTSTASTIHVGDIPRWDTNRRYHSRPKWPSQSESLSTKSGQVQFDGTELRPWT